MKKSKLIYAAVIMVLFSFFMTGCTILDKPKRTMDIYCELLYKGEEANTSKLGISDEDKNKFIEEYESKIKESLKNNMNMWGYTASDDELQAVCDGYRQAISKTTYEVKTISKSKDKAEVQISATHFDQTAIDEKAVTSALDEVEKMTFTNNDDEEKKFASTYLSNLAEELKNAELSTEKSSMTVTLIKKDKKWQPEDYNNLSYKMINLVRNDEYKDINIDDETITPDESVEIFWNAIIKSDYSGMEKLGFSKAFIERCADKSQKIEIEKFKSDFKSDGISITDEQALEVLKSLREALSKTKPTYEVISKKDGLAKVKITSNYIDTDVVMKEAIENSVAQALLRGITDEAGIVKIVLQNMASSMRSAEVSNKTDYQSFEFVKVGDKWFPKDGEALSSGILKLVAK